MKTKFFLMIFLFCTTAVVWAQMDAGFYQFSSPSSASSPSNVTSETTIPAPQVVEAPAATLRPSATPAPPATPPGRPVARPEETPVRPSAQPPARDYTTRRTGDRAAGREILTRLESCNTIRLISGKKPRNAPARPACSPLTIAESFVDTLMSQLPICIREGMQKKGINKTIAYSNVYNAGSLGQRPGSRISTHETARALDIWQIDLKFTDGTTLNTPMTVNSRNDAFYKGFNDCWERLIKEKMRSISSSCRNYKGLVDCNDNRDHHDHVHISLPYCPARSGYRLW